MKIKNLLITLTLLHSERPKLHTILAFLGAIGLSNHRKPAGECRILQTVVDSGSAYSKCMIIKICKIILTETVTQSETMMQMVSPC